jgi:hypothetical protein
VPPALCFDSYRRVGFGLRGRDRHKRDTVQQVAGQGRAERRRRLADRSFLVFPLRGAPLVDALLEIEDKLVGGAKGVALARRVFVEEIACISGVR